MGDTPKPTRDKDLYIMTWQHPDDDGNKHLELINGFGRLQWVIEGILQIRWITETIAQNRILRIREQFSFWGGGKMDSGEHMLTRTLDGKVIGLFPARNKPVCPKCKVNVLVLDDICPKCIDVNLERLQNSRSNACNSKKHSKCKGVGLLPITREPCICDCHTVK